MRRKSHAITVRRKALGLSGNALAKQVGISATHLHDIETGRIASPSVDLALRLAEALSIDVRQLFRTARPLVVPADEKAIAS